MISLNVKANFKTVESLVFSLTESMSSDQLYKLIILIDDYLQDYKFTKKLRNRFSKIIEVEDKSDA